ncbi:MAG: hypothetical protein QF792_01630 [Phycisphaerae bacterium]|nr:hypothetical protein [Phycisphaerae bacterium]
MSRRASRRHGASHKEARRAYCTAYRRKNRDKTLAHAMVKAAVMLGVLVRRPCEVCGARPGEGGQRIYAHHEDYARPLEVRWLCATSCRSTPRSFACARRGKTAGGG